MWVCCELACTACECGSGERWLYGGGDGVLPLVLASGGLCMKRDGGCWCGGAVRLACVVVGCGRSVAPGSGGLRSRVCGFMHRDEGRNIERQGRGKQRKALRFGINARNATQRIDEGQKIPAFGRVGICWKIWIFIDLTKLRQSFLSVLTI